MNKELKSVLRLVIALIFAFMSVTIVWNVGISAGGGAKGIELGYSDAVGIGFTAIGIFIFETLILHLIRKPIGISRTFRAGLIIIDIIASFFMIKWYIEGLSQPSYALHSFFNVFGAVIIALYLGLRVWHIVIMTQAIKQAESDGDIE